MKRNFVLLLAVLVTALFSVEMTLASVPMLISHQGRLLDASNQPVTGTRNLTFKIFETPTGGSPLWTESHLAVPIANGLFNVILGSTIAISGDLVVTSGTLETERYLAIQVEGDVDELSPRRRLTSSAYAVATSRVSGDVVTSPGQVSLSGMSGSTTATIRSSQNQGSEGSEVVLVDGNGSTTGTIRAASSTGAQVHLSGMSGSTTGTIRMAASPDSADHEVSVDDTLSGISSKVKEKAHKTKCSANLAYLRTSAPASSTELDESCDAISASSKWKGMSGSTTGTIRMAATPDSVGNYFDIDVDGDGHQERNIGIYVSDISGQSKMECLADTDDDGVPDNSVEQVSNASKAYMAIKTKGTGAQRTTILAEASDSGIFDISVDDDGDGTARAKGIITVKPTAGGTGGTKGKFSYDVDDDGDFDNEFDITSNAVGAGTRLIGRGGSTTGTIRMMATPDSSVFDLGISGSTTGTIRIQTSSTGTANPIEHSSGAHLTVGGDWTNASDKNSKENFSDIDGVELLEKIEELSITQWNYKSEGESITHIGPTAQDFKAAFGVGSNDKSISTIDPSGIALAAIKELNKQNQELAKQNAKLMKELKELKKKVDDLASRR